MTGSLEEGLLPQSIARGAPGAKSNKQRSVLHIKELGLEYAMTSACKISRCWVVSQQFREVGRDVE